MKTIEPHFANEEHLVDEQNVSKESLLDIGEKMIEKRNLDMYYQDAIKIVNVNEYLAGSQQESLEWLTAAKDAYLAFFRLSHAKSTEQVTFEVRGKMYSLEPFQSVRMAAGLLGWLTALDLCIVLRDYKGIEELIALKFTADQVLEIKTHDFEFPYVQFMQALLGNNQGEAGAKLIETYKLTDPSHFEGRPYLNTVLDLIVPVLDLYSSLLFNDAAEFNQRLEEALLLYRKSCEDNPDNVGWLIAHAHLAVCCLAYDRGFPIEVESRYIPRWLIEYSPD